jgi:hypothetical protein
LKANKVNLFASSVLLVFWYHSTNLLDTPRNHYRVTHCLYFCVWELKPCRAGYVFLPYTSNLAIEALLFPRQWKIFTRLHGVISHMVVMFIIKKFRAISRWTWQSYRVYFGWIFLPLLNAEARKCMLKHLHSLNWNYQEVRSENIGWSQHSLEPGKSEFIPN